MRNRRHREYFEKLSSIPLFRSLERRELELVARVADVAEADTGAVLVEESRFGHHLYVIVEGSAAALEGDRPSAMLGPGDFVGEAAVFAGGRHPASVVAATPLRVLVLGRREVLELVRSVPVVARRLLERLAARDGKPRPAGRVVRATTEEVR